MSGRRTDFFLSHAGRDTAWAEWLAWQLQQAGYRVELDVQDWAPGEDFVARMSAALERADRLDRVTASIGQGGGRTVFGLLISGRAAHRLRSLGVRLVWRMHVTNQRARLLQPRSDRVVYWPPDTSQAVEPTTSWWSPRR